MKSRKLLASLLVSISLLNIGQLQVFAETKKSPITIDGNFSDWNNMPYVSDRKGDVPNGMNNEDITGVKYYSDGEYLYLYVERQSAGHSKQDGWTFHVIFPDAKQGGRGNSESIEVNGKCQMVQYRYAIVNLISGKGNEYSLNVDSGKYQEQTLSVSDNKKEMEFRVPLKEFGLDKQKEIRFALKSNVNGEVCPAKNTIDWVPDRDGWINIDNGPTLWQFSAIIGFGIAGFAAYRIFRFQKRSKN
ncbi:Firmicu-CTERM sorting domain-containing protein [Bacillus sp. S14(2024)]|uniref:Firmicu-CTERM sorting domain-containing protein n=1 Tax=Bacillus sp. S14(2024) TaxID=3162884 RepID=UPI003D2350B4